MAISLREKSSLYRSLAEFAKTGIPFPAAIAKLAATARGDSRALLRRIQAALAAGATVGDAFSQAQPQVSALEAGVVEAVDRSGRVEHGLMQLAEYFAALAAARGTLLTNSAYPVFLFNFGVLLSAAVKALPPFLMRAATVAETARVFFAAAGTLLIWFWGAVLIAWLLGKLLGDLAGGSALWDRVLRAVPLTGGIRRAFASARFCLTYELQLDAGLNLFSALDTAARASRSGLIRSAVARALPAIRAGAKAGPELGATDALPQEVIHAIVLGEETGALDRELRRVAAEQQAAALRGLDRLTEWLPRLLYIAIALYVGWIIVSMYAAYFKTISDLTGG